MATKLLSLLGAVWVFEQLRKNYSKKKSGVESAPTSHALRLRPGEELKSALVNYVKEKKIKACAIVTCVGSLRHVHLRLANATSEDQNHTLTRDENFEIISLVGTLSCDSGCHIHISLGDKDGNVIGGHLMGDAVVFTTAEIVLLELNNYTFERKFDQETGFDELAPVEKCHLCGCES